jgi:glycosyltransferase involved in cell wall biosynthesis
MSALALNVPVNSSSFGQVSLAILRELFYKSIDPVVFPIAGSIDPLDECLAEEPDGFVEWLKKCERRSLLHDRGTPSFKLWHLNGSLESFSKSQALMTFYECNEPTPEEKNAAKNNKLIVTNNHTHNIFKAEGIDSTVIPLGFDHHNFEQTNKKYFDDDRICFNLCGKFEKRKNHRKIIKAWVKRFGNKSQYYLQCALWNNFFSEEDNKNNFVSCVEGKSYFNVQFMSYLPSNKLYNDFLNSGDIVIAMSGGEGWGLPEFQSLCLGKHAVVLDAHAYKDWANKENSTLVSPSGEMDVYDGFFFKKGAPFNQGTFCDFDEDEFIDGCEKAIGKLQENKVNQSGVKLKNKFNYKYTAEKIIETLNDM